MSRPAILQVLPLLTALEKPLRERYDVTMLPPAGAQRDAFLAAQGARFTGLVTAARGGADAALLAALPHLRVISSFGVGTDRIDLPEAARRGIRVGYTPDVLNDCVADLAFGLLLDIGRRISQGDRFVRAGRWASGTIPLGRRVSGARLAIVGLGRIGKTIARRASGFEMEVRYHTRRVVADVPFAHEPDLKALARWCDFMVLITAGGPATRHLVDASVLDALGTKGFLVNVSRGTVVDEEALVAALKEGRIGGAALDVYLNEPHVPQELLALDNVVLVPHIASSTHQTRQAMADRVLDNLDAFFASGTLVSEAGA